MFNNYNRYQKGLKVKDLYPGSGTHCACGCGNKLTGKQTKWASKECNDRTYLKVAILKGNNSIIRKELFNRDQGFCHNCGVYDENWQADHIKPVANGGGGCDLNNYQTLCMYCHKEKTKNQIVSHRKAISSQEALNASMLRLYAAGDVP